ncbi:Predicted kinase, aminoglycoside phosphotransferase (APT) family [Nocardioides scoriae]|uniref:Predicted kinase, aminoglycoside phosphotransferase (APT) family n=1 Tax=Nocardioides scoriae TaxID=642780 RepID=A0A1H1WUW0_9ACTN|nr:aminoglycoside phosphotransferase family protein [Nocardioides scoriae]SDT00430.1 Predicted kinase, aminoglycoside phosphotransferase (APT) family [Nocardioides scoriae]
MTRRRMHPDQVDTSVDLVRRLLAAQHPRWADLPVEPVVEAGTDHDLYRLGHDLLVRLPVIGWAAGQAARDARWLPVLGQGLRERLPGDRGCEVPAPVALGAPGEGYAHPWSVVPWIEGVVPTAHDDDDLLGRDLAELVVALQRIAPADGPARGPGERGGPLGVLDAEVRARLAGPLPGLDVTALREVWERAVTAPAWEAAPVWLHGDLQAGNLLVRDGRLAAVIDWGGLGVGDPAADLAPAWTLPGARARAAYRLGVGYDAPTWSRAAGWVLAPALAGLDYYASSRPDLSAESRRRLELLAAGPGPISRGDPRARRRSRRRRRAARPGGRGGA